MATLTVTDNASTAASLPIGRLAAEEVLPVTVKVAI